MKAMKNMKLFLFLKNLQALHVLHGEN